MKEVEQKVESKSEKIEGKKLIAKKDFKFAFGKDVYVIKKGDEIKVPKMFHENLKTEKVI